MPNVGGSSNISFGQSYLLLTLTKCIRLTAFASSLLNLKIKSTKYN